MPPQPSGRTPGKPKRAGASSAPVSSSLPPISQLQPTPRGRRAPRASLTASQRKPAPTKTPAVPNRASNKRQWRPSLLRASLPSLAQRQQTVRDQATLALSHMCSTGRNNLDDTSQDSFTRTGPIKLDDVGLRLYNAFTATKEANLSAQKWLDLAELSEQFPDELRDPHGSLNTLIRLSNLTTFLYHVLSSAPDDAQGGAPPRGATARLSDAASAWLRHVVPADKAADDGCLRILSMINRQIYLAASATSRGANPDVAQIFSRPLTGYQSAEGASAQPLADRSAERMFAALQSGAAAEVQSVDGDVSKLVDKPGWKWDDMAIECVNFVERVAESVGAAEMISHDEHESQLQAELEQDQDQEGHQDEEKEEVDMIKSSPDVDRELSESVVAAVVSNVEVETQIQVVEDSAPTNGVVGGDEHSGSASQSQSKDSYDTAVPGIDSQTRENIELYHHLLQDDDDDDQEGGEDEARGDAESDSDEKENIDPALADNIALYHDLLNASDNEEQGDEDSPLRETDSGLAAGIALYKKLAGEDTDSSQESSLEPPQPGPSKSHIAIGAGNRLEQRAGSQPQATMRKLLQAQPDAERLEFSGDELSSGSSSAPQQRAKSKRTQQRQKGKGKKAKKAPTPVVVPAVELPRAAARQRESRQEPDVFDTLQPLPDYSPEREFGGEGYMGAELDDEQQAGSFENEAGEELQDHDDDGEQFHHGAGDEVPFGQHELQMPRSEKRRLDKGKGRAVNQDDDQELFREDDSSEDEDAVRSNRLRKRYRTSLLDRVLQPLPTQHAGTLETSAERREATQLTRDVDRDHEKAEVAQGKKRRLEKDAELIRKFKFAYSDNSDSDDVEAEITASRPNTYRQGRNGSSGLRVPWSTTEEQFLIKVMSELGAAWSQMIALYGPNGTNSRIFEKRTAMSLKDKAVNVKLSYLKTGKALPPCFEEVSVPLSKLPKHLRDVPVFQELAPAQKPESSDDDDSDSD
ncbi:hypothetical protein ACM66B_007002 [Microbotryomycetes sp. NB124-2]